MNQMHLRLAARAIHRGGVVAYPTEGVFGLGCDPLDADAGERLLALKDRDPGKGLILIGADWQQLEDFAQPLDPGTLAMIMAEWPGPVTWVLEADFPAQ